MAHTRLFFAFILNHFLNEILIISSQKFAISLQLNINKKKKEFLICKKDFCNQAANELLENINLDADPCEDFYKFACGKFITREIPKDKIAISTVATVNEKLLENLKSILEEDISKTKFNFAKQTMLSFKSCMDTSSIDKTGLEALKTAISDKFGGWPLLDGDNWKEEEHDLTQILIKLQMHQMMGLFDIVFHNVEASINFKVPVILPPQLTFPAAYYQKDSPKFYNVGVLVQHTLNVSLLLGATATNNLEAINRTIEFEIELSKCIILNDDENASHMLQHKLITLDKLKEKFEKSFDFDAFFKTIFKEVNIDIKSNENIATFAMTYLNCLSKILESTPKKQIVNYLIWKAFGQTDIAFPSHFTEGRRYTKPRWELCTNFVNINLHKAIGYMYLTKDARYKAKPKILQIIKILKRNHAKLISNRDWLHTETKKEAMKKLKEMKEHVSFPDGLFDNEVLEEEFKGVEFNDKAFVEVFFKLKEMKMKQQMRPIRYPINRDNAEIPIATVNAFYDYYNNRIVVPAGFIEAPFYSDQYPKYLNMGGMGFFLGHEMIHGFDTKGSLFDYEGSSKDWWKEEDKMEFTNKSECFVRQYNDLTLEQINEKVNGKRTVAENIADSGGIRIAFMAYRSWLRKHGEEKQLNGLPYTSEQMFFIAFARNFCQKVISVLAAVDLRTDNHAPNIFRVNMPLKNLKAFSDVFKCKKNSGMTVRKRCRIW